MNSLDLSDEKHLAYIGAKIAAARHTRGEKIDTLALAVGVTAKVISQVENGRYPALKELLLKKICDHLQMPLSELFSGGVS